MAKQVFTIGDGASTSFDLSLLFDTGRALVECFDLSRGGNKVFAFGLQRRTPDTFSVRLSLRPAPPQNSIVVHVTDNTEKP